MQAARIGGRIVHYRDEGPKDGPVLVFSNSLGTDLRIWDAVLAALPAGLRTIRYDTRGHGLSEGEVGPYFMGDLVADLGGLLDHLGVARATVVGLSIGGMIAQGLAAERPELVERLVLMDTGVKIGTEEMWASRMEAIRRGGIESIADAVLERWFSRGYEAANPTLMALWRTMLVRTPVEGYLGCCAAIGATDLYESTARLTLPAMVLVGAEDGATPPDLVRETAALIEGASFHIIRRAGHLPCLEQPEEVARLIGDFVAPGKG